MYFCKHPVRCAGLWGLFCLTFVFGHALHADDFSIIQANTHLTGHMYQLDAEIQYQLSDESINALHNGVALTLVLLVKVRKQRWYLWNKKVAEIKQTYVLRYQPLTEQYQVNYLNTGIEEYFDSLNILLVNLGIVENLPLLDEKFINDNKKYRVQLSTKLDIEALPAPLRPLAYISSAWRLSSGDYVCRLAK